MARPGDLQQLLRLADAAFEGARSEMQRLIQREARLRAQIAELEKARNETAQQPRGQDDAALVAGADLRWHRWIDHRRTVLNVELSQVLALKAIRQASVEAAFGRQQAIAALDKKASEAAKRLARRRAL